MESIHFFEINQDTVNSLQTLAGIFLFHVFMKRFCSSPLRAFTPPSEFVITSNAELKELSSNAVIRTFIPEDLWAANTAPRAAPL